MVEIKSKTEYTKTIKQIEKILGEGFDFIKECELIIRKQSKLSSKHRRFLLLEIFFKYS